MDRNNTSSKEDVVKICNQSLFYTDVGITRLLKHNF